MTEQPTCGQGVAMNATLPAALGDVLAAMATNLDVHRRALDTDDPAARAEHETYTALITQHRHTAEALQAIAQRMRAAHDLPMAPHNMARMTTPEVLHAFEGLMHAEDALLALVQSRLEQERTMRDVIARNVEGRA